MDHLTKEVARRRVTVASRVPPHPSEQGSQAAFQGLPGAYRWLPADAEACPVGDWRMDGLDYPVRSSYSPSQQGAPGVSFRVTNTAHGAWMSRRGFYALRSLTFGAAMAIVAGLTGCVTNSYVDLPKPVLTAKQLPTVQHPQPVTVLFQFLTNGKENAAATGLLKERVLGAVSGSNMFSRVNPAVDSSQPNILEISIDDQADMGKAEAQGFGTGLTLGLAGSLLQDAYVCTASYTSGGRKSSATGRAAILSAVGLHSAPPGLKPVEQKEAIYEVVDQLIWHSLAQLDGAGAFAQSQP